MSATPEQIAELCERLDEPSNWMKEGRANEDWNTLRGTYDKAPFEAAALIRAQAERVRVLESALSGLFARLDHPGNGGQHVNYFLRWPEVEAARAALTATGAPQ